MPDEKKELLKKLNDLVEKKITEDTTNYDLFNYFYNCLVCDDNSEDLALFLAFLAKKSGQTNPEEYKYNREKQVLFETIMYSGFSLYENKLANKNKIHESYKKFIEECRNKQGLESLQAIKEKSLNELGYNQLTDDNAREVFCHIPIMQDDDVKIYKKK